MDNYVAEYQRRMLQTQKVINELNILKIMYYDPDTSNGGKAYEKVSNIINDIIFELEERFGMDELSLGTGLESDQED